MFPLARHRAPTGFALWLAIIACARTAGAQPKGLECFVELPVFDPLGNRVPFEIIAVHTQDLVGSDVQESGPNLLTSTSEDRPVVGENDRLYIPKHWIGHGLVIVKLKAVNQEEAKKALDMTRTKGPLAMRATLELTSCQQRTSLRIGIKDTNVDVFVSTIKGRVTGCQINGGWWIRAMPMFGGQDQSSIYEGLVRPVDGSFSLIAHMRGERHILIVGRGKQPLAAIGVNVTSGGGKTDVGSLDLSTMCSNERASEQ